MVYCDDADYFWLDNSKAKRAVLTRCLPTHSRSRVATKRRPDENFPPLTNFYLRMSAFDCCLSLTLAFDFDRCNRFSKLCGRQ